MATPLERRIAQAQAYWRLAVKYKYKWYILVSSLALALVFNVMIARFPNVYEATTTILVDPQQIPENYVSPAVNSDPSSRLNTLTQQVLSTTRLQEIIDKLNLYPEQRRSISPKELIEEMRHDITIQLKVKQGSVPELGTFTVTYQGKNPMLTAEVANELANSFIRWNIAGTKDFLSSKLDAAKQKQQAERFTVLDMAEVPEKPIRPRRKLLILFSSSVAFGLSIFFLLEKEKNNPSVNTEMELNALLPKGARIMGLIPRIVIASDTRRDRRLTIFACIVCGLLCLALISIIWQIHWVL